MKTEIILYSDIFKPKKEFIELIQKLGYDNYTDLNCRIDYNVIDYVKNNLSNWFEAKVYLGEKNSELKCGFLGFAFIREIDLNRPFRFVLTNKEFSFISIDEKIIYKDEQEEKVEWNVIESISELE